MIHFISKQRHCATAVLLLTAILLCLGQSGCVTKAKAEAQARAAYAAGQQQALRQQATQNITFIGQIKNPVLPWRENLTLAQAIIEANYSGVAQPTDIYVVRNGAATHVDVDKLLNGEDMALKPGDVIQIK